jgi:hypothetical protein
LEGQGDRVYILKCDGGFALKTKDFNDIRIVPEIFFTAYKEDGYSGTEMKYFRKPLSSKTHQTE